MSAFSDVSPVKSSKEVFKIIARKERRHQAAAERERRFGDFKEEILDRLTPERSSIAVINDTQYRKWSAILDAYGDKTFYLSFTNVASFAIEYKDPYKGKSSTHVAKPLEDDIIVPFKLNEITSLGGNHFICTMDLPARSFKDMKARFNIPFYIDDVIEAIEEDTYSIISSDMSLSEPRKGRLYLHARTFVIELRTPLR
jgi:hypothetical protein